MDFAYRNMSAPESPRETVCGVDLSEGFGKHSSLVQLWEQQQLCDVILAPSDGPEIPAHKVVLAASSGFFRALLVGAGSVMREGQSSGSPLRVPLPDLQHHWVLAVVGAMYHQRLQINWEDIPSLMATSSFLEVAPVLEACCQHVLKNLELGNCLEALAMASACNCASLESAVKQYVCAHFSQLMASPHRASLLRLPPHLLLDLLQADHLDVDTELDVFHAVMEWVTADPPSRSQYAASLVSTIRLPTDPFLPPSGPPAPSTPSSSSASAHFAACHVSHAGSPLQVSLLAELAAGGGQGVGGLQRVGSLPEVVGGDMVGSPGGVEALAGAALMAASSRRKHKTTGLLVAGGRDEGWRCLKTSEQYDPLKDSWTPGPPLPIGLSFAAAATVEREVVASGGSSFTASAVRLDPRQGVWRLCAPPPTPRIHTAAASLAGAVYVLGGRSQVQQVLSEVERYLPATDTWEPLGGMRVPRYALGCAALGGRIFAVGGQGGRTLERSVECFDPEAQQWSLLGARLGCERKYTAVGALAGRLYVVGGVDGRRARLSSVEALDPREGRWHPLPPMSWPRSSCGVAALQGCLYVMGGNCGDDAIDDTLERFEPAMQRWVPCAPLGSGRSGFFAVAL